MDKKKISSNKQRISLLLFGLILGLVLLEYGLRVGRFALLQLQSHRNKVSDISACRILCLGDSFTYGVGAPLGKDYPSQLEGILNTRCGKNKFKVINRGIPGGYPSLGLPDVVDECVKKYDPQILILMLRFHEYQWAGIQTYAFDASQRSLRKSFELWVSNLRIYRLGKWLEESLFNKLDEMELNKAENKKESLDSERLKRKKAFVTSADQEEMKPVETELILKRAKKISPNDDMAYLKLGDLYRKAGRYAQAISMYKKSIEVAYTVDIGIYINLGDCYKYLQKYSEAIESYKKAVDLDYTDSKAYCKVGNCYMVQGENKQAMEWYKKCLALDPLNEKGWVEAGYLYRKQNEHEKAEKIYSNVIKLSPDCSFAYQQLADCYREQGKYEEARKNYLNVKMLERKTNKIIDENLERIFEITEKKGIILIIMPYPLQSAEELDRVSRYKKNVLCVDNMRIFIEALGSARSKEEYFVPDGHCNEKGYRLIAENVADAVDKLISCPK